MVPNCIYSVTSVRLAGSNCLIHLAGKKLFVFLCVSLWTSSVGFRDSQNSINQKQESKYRSSCKKWGEKYIQR